MWPTRCGHTNGEHTNGKGPNTLKIENVMEFCPEHINTGPFPGPSLFQLPNQTMQRLGRRERVRPQPTPEAENMKWVAVPV